MRPNITEETIEELTNRADQVMRVDAEQVSIEERLKAVLSTVEDLDDEMGRRWFES